MAAGKQTPRSERVTMSSGAQVRGSGMDLLVEAGAVLATSLDLPTTMSQGARLTPPALADLCGVDGCDRDGSIPKTAVAAHHPRPARAPAGPRGRLPPGPRGRAP